LHPYFKGGRINRTGNRWIIPSPSPPAHGTRPGRNLAPMLLGKKRSVVCPLLFRETGQMKARPSVGGRGFSPGEKPTGLRPAAPWATFPAMWARFEPVSGNKMIEGMDGRAGYAGEFGLKAAASKQIEGFRQAYGFFRRRPLAREPSRISSYVSGLDQRKKTPPPPAFWACGQLFEFARPMGFYARGPKIGPRRRRASITKSRGATTSMWNFPAFGTNTLRATSPDGHASRFRPRAFPAARRSTGFSRRKWVRRR